MATHHPLIVAIVLCGISASPLAGARDAEGRLDQILFPHEGCPVVIVPGQAFYVIAREPAELLLETEEEATPLAVSWSAIPGRRALGRVVAGSEVAPGRYTLRWRIAERIDRNEAAIRIVSEFDELYDIDIIRDPEFTSAASIRRFFESRDDSNVPITLSGRIVSEDRAEIHKHLLEALRVYPGTVFVAPRTAAVTNTADAFWGAQPFQFRYGPDAYLVWSGEMGFDINGMRVEELHRLRRAAVSARWSMGFVPEPPTRGKLRAYLTLSIDEPLDYVFTRDSDRALGAYPATRTGAISLPVPGTGGSTRIRMGPGAVNVWDSENEEEAAGL